MTVITHERVQEKLNSKIQQPNRYEIELEKFELQHINYINTIPIVNKKEKELRETKQEQEESALREAQEEEQKTLL